MQHEVYDNSGDSGFWIRSRNNEWMNNVEIARACQFLRFELPSVVLPKRVKNFKTVSMIILCSVYKVSPMCFVYLSYRQIVLFLV